MMLRPPAAVRLAFLGFGIFHAAPMMAQVALAAPKPGTPALTIRATPRWAASPEAVDYLAKIGVETRIEAPPETSLRTIVRSFCGNEDPHYLDIAIKRNGLTDPNAAIGSAGVVVLPACAAYTLPQPRTVENATTVRELLTRETGFAGQATAKDFAQRNRIKQSWRVVLDKVITKTQTVMLPYRSIWTSVAIKPEAGVSAAEAAAHLQSIAKPDVGSSFSAVNDSSFGSLIGSVPQGDLQSNMENCGDAANASPPVDIAAFVSMLDHTTRIARARNIYQPDVALGIIDSGLLAFGVPPFTDDRFKKDTAAPSSRNAEDSDDDNDGLRNEYYGPNAAYRRGWPIPPAGAEDADHGTIIAGIALGGPTFIATNTPGLSSLKLRVASAVQASSPFVSPSQLSISEAALGVALADFAQQQVTIVNASFRFRTKLTAIEEALNNNRQLLLIAAAGNDYKAYTSDIWPAAYGGALGDFKRQVITVGAARGDGRRADFSNYSQRYMDVLAAGCSIDSYVALMADGSGFTTDKSSGTSQATPSVTFLAGLLKQNGIAQPRLIKDRILASVDERRDLAAFAASSGVVNPLKTIAIFDDLVELDDRSILLGSIDRSRPFSISCADGRAPDMRRLRKIARIALSDGQQMWSVRWQDDQSNWDQCDADLSTLKLPFLVDGSARDPMLTTIKDIIPRSIL